MFHVIDSEISGMRVVVSSVIALYVNLTMRMHDDRACLLSKHLFLIISSLFGALVLCLRSIASVSD